MRVDSILQTIGETPHVRLNRLYGGSDHAVYLKLERANPGGSIKDRIALAMIETAERDGTLAPDGVIVEPTSGNTGIGLAMVAAVKGYRLILTMPESMSLERRRYLKALGAELVLTPRTEGMGGAISKAKEIQEATPGAWIPQQFENPANPQIHAETTAREIAKDFADGLDYLITGVGTGGHITGCARTLKEIFPDLQVFAVEPEASAVISGGEKGLHPLQGIGAGFIPMNLDTSLLDGVIRVSGPDAFAYANRCVREEGIFVGISTGASLAAVAQKLPEMPSGSRIVTFCYDTGERYLSVDNLFADEDT